MNRKDAIIVLLLLGLQVLFTLAPIAFIVWVVIVLLRYIGAI